MSITRKVLPHHCLFKKHRFKGRSRKKRIISLSQLRKNVRTKPDKKSGWKKPGKGDLDRSEIIAAPDSLLAQSFVNSDSDESFEGKEKNEQKTSTPRNNIAKYIC